MKPRLNVVTLGVLNLERSAEFYRNALGWEPAGGSTENIVFFNHGGIILSLYPFDKLAEDANVPAVRAGTSGITLAIARQSKEDVDMLYKQAIEHGATPLVEPRDTFWGGYDAYFADPDGQAWEIIWAPSWKYDEMGNMKM